MVGPLGALTLWLRSALSEEVGPTFELTGQFCSLRDYTINS